MRLDLNDLFVAEYTALQIKQAVVGNGHAKKEQVQEMVSSVLLGLPSTARTGCRRMRSLVLFVMLMVAQA